jgi:putative nucleotidyltransferase with HDIG domain
VNSSITRRRLYLLGQWWLLAASVAGAILTSRSVEWKPIGLVVLLVALCLGGQRFTLRIRSQQLSPAFIALVVAMTLLGPAPAAAMGVATMVLDGFVRRVPRAPWLNNVATYAAFPLIGGLLARAVLGYGPVTVHTNATLPLTAFGVFFATNVLNFGLIAFNKLILEGRSIVQQVRELLLPILPSQFAAGALAAMLAWAYTRFGYGALVLVVVVIVVFQYLAIALLRSEERAEQLATHSQRLATLQLGVLVTLVETLQLRDATTARHAAAVARYARELARELVLDEREQDYAHSAGLLHDIGKFAFPDRVLTATGALSQSDRSLIRRHPQDGATLVGRLDGYGPVADAILYHHERVDGTGYPAGLIGTEIPLLSRILAVCETYDVLTARDSYRVPVLDHEAAFAELRRAAGRQLDRELVERFIAMMERLGPETVAASDMTSFEEELDFERRARALARVD